MPRLIQNNDFVDRERIRLDNPDAAAGIGNALSRAGESQRNAAARLKQDADVSIAKANQAAEAHARFREAARRSEVNSVANDAVVRASQEYLTKSAERIQQKTDKDGNPTFSTLAQDLQEIGRDVAKNYGKLGDRDASSAFGTAFGSFLASRTASVLQEARTQQLDFAKTSLVRTTDSIKNLAAQEGITAWPSHEEMLTSVLRGAIADGTVTSAEALALEKDVRKGAVESVLNREIFNNPEKLLVDLANGAPEDFGATPDQYNHAIQMAQTSILKRQKEAKKEEEKAKKLADSENYAKLKAMTDSVGINEEAGIADESAKALAKEVEYQIFNNTALTDSQRMQLNNDLRRTHLNTDKKNKAITELMGQIDAGSVPVDATASDINAAFNTYAQLAEKNKGEPLTTQDKVVLAKSIKAPVTTLIKEAESYAASGSVEQRVAMAKSVAWANSSRGNPQTFEGMDATSTAFYAYINSRITTDGMNQDKVVKDAEDLFYNTPAVDVKDWRDQGITAGLDEATSILEEATGSDKSSQLTNNDISHIFERNMLAARGDTKTARQMTVDVVRKQYGTSRVTDAMKNGVFSSDTTMKFPPEKVAGIDDGDTRRMEALKGDLEDTIKDAAMPANRTVEDVMVRVLDLPGKVTGAPNTHKIFVPYVLDDNGVPVDLVDKHGASILWEVYPGVADDAILEKQKAMDMSVRGQVPATTNAPEAAVKPGKASASSKTTYDTKYGKMSKQDLQRAIDVQKEQLKFVQDIEAMTPRDHSLDGKSAALDSAIADADAYRAAMRKAAEDNIKELERRLKDK